jgi:hypothetical protein
MRSPNVIFVELTPPMRGFLKVVIAMKFVQKNPAKNTKTDKISGKKKSRLFGIDKISQWDK